MEKIFRRLNFLVLGVSGGLGSFVNSQSFLTSDSLNGFPAVDYSSTVTSNVWPQNFASQSFNSQASPHAIGTSAAPGAGRGLYEYDLVIIGLGVGGHGAALHAVSQGLKTAVVSAPGDAGGTCVNRGCVPSKALLAAAHKFHSVSDEASLKQFGISVSGKPSVDREVVARHATNLASNTKAALASGMKRHGVEIIDGIGTVPAPHQVLVEGTARRLLTARDIILAPGSAPTIPPGMIVDGVNVITSDQAVGLPSLPEWVLIVGGGYIGLEFAEIYSSLGAGVTIVEAMDRILPTFDSDIAQLADKLILQPRKIEKRTSVIAEVTAGAPGVRPTEVRLLDIKTKSLVDTLQVDLVMVATGRQSVAANLKLENVGVDLLKGNVVPVDDKMRVLNRAGEAVHGLYCIGDANGKFMLAHAASAQGVSAVENIVGRPHVLNHNHIPAAAFTHPQIASVGLSEPTAASLAASQGFALGKAVAHFRANTKALAEGASGGQAKLLFRKDTGAILGAQMIGLHASDLVQQIANAMAAGTTVHQMAMMVHSHPTLSEISLDLYKNAAGLLSH